MAGMHKLTATGAKALATPGRHSDGGGLYLRIQKGGRKSWLFMWKRQGRQREVGLGAFNLVSLKAARAKAQTARDALAMSLDPRTVLNPVQGKTFLETALACMEARKIETMNPATQRKWERTVMTRCAGLHNSDVSTIGREDVLRILKPIWSKTPEAARYARTHMEIIFDYAKGRDWRGGDNPAAWRGGLETVLPKQDRKSVKHHPAMDYDDMPAFVSRLRRQAPLSARALELLILTATRTTEVRCCVANEFDLDAETWTIPGERMKAKETHVIPLSKRALEIVRPLIEAHGPNDYVFPGRKPGSPISNHTMLRLLKRMGHEGLTVHGFRSTMRDWAGDKTNHAKEIAEVALSHSVGSTMERSYRRMRALEKRRALMEDWARFVSGETATVVKLHA